MVEPRLVSDSLQGSALVGQRLLSDLFPGSAVVGGKIGAGLERLYGSPTVVVWSQGMCISRAKTVMGCEF